MIHTRKSRSEPKWFFILFNFEFLGIINEFLKVYMIIIFIC